MEDLEIKMEPPEDDIVVDNVEDQPEGAEGEMEPVPAHSLLPGGAASHC